MAKTLKSLGCTSQVFCNSLEPLREEVKDFLLMMASENIYAIDESQVMTVWFESLYS